MMADDEFGDYFATRLQRSNLLPEQLCLEITETSVVRDLGRNGTLSSACVRWGLPFRVGRLRHWLLFVQLPA